MAAATAASLGVSHETVDTATRSSQDGIEGDRASVDPHGSSGSGHIATDDKARLAALAAAASHPLPGSSAPMYTSEPSASVPAAALPTSGDTVLPSSPPARPSLGPASSRLLDL